MRTELVDNGILKILLTSSDLEKLNITFEQLNYEDDNARQTFWDLLSQAKQEVDFEYRTGGKLMIEVFPTVKSGCAIFYTIIKDKIVSDKKLKLKLQQLQPHIYSFKNFENLILSLKFLNDKIWSTYKSQLFIKNDEYYLVLNMYPAINDNIKIKLEEYGKYISNTKINYTVLKEHNNCIIEHNAIKTLKYYFI